MARSFDGVADVAVVTVNLVGAQAVTVAAWMKRSSNPANRIIFEYGLANGFDVVSAGVNDLIRCYGLVSSADTYPIPSFDVWHHYLWIINGGPAAGHYNRVIIDGEEVALTAAGGSGENIAWANAPLTIGGRVGSAFMPCELAELGLWNGYQATTPIGPPIDTSRGLSSGWTPPHLLQDPTLYIPMLGDDPEPDYMGGQYSAVLTGTTYTNHPPTKTILMPGGA